MTCRIMILTGLFLVLNVWLIAGDENNTTMDNMILSSTPATVEEAEASVEDIKTPLQTIEREESKESDIDRSSHFHHLVHGGLYHQHHHGSAAYHGFWKKKFVWRPRWVKTWQEKKVYVAVWKRMWGPATINEWVPVPKPPPGWIKPSLSGLVIKTIPY